MTLTSVKPIDKLEVGKGGGKAAGLSLLKHYGLAIPDTTVIVDENKESIRQFINTLPEDKFYAVRSSADVEDGIEHSFAGQFSSYLNVQGHHYLYEAIMNCFNSFHSITAEAYKQNINSRNGSGMNVLVQEMINPKFSGVLFTSDPVEQRHDIITMSIIEGVGEDLMAGHEAGENLHIFKHNYLQTKSNLLSAEELEQLIESALLAEKKYGKACDLEWAIDENNKIWWLQLRPVTKLSEVHFNELDDKPLYREPLYTRGNIGEMMPGPITPLTLSTFARAIEIGLQVFYKKIGALKELSEHNLFVHSYYNHLFFDMNRLYNSVRYVSISSKENIDYAIVGEIVPGVQVEKESNFLQRSINSVKMIRFIGSAPKAWKQLKAMHDKFSIVYADDLQSCYNLISDSLQLLYDAYSLHYVTSSQSGALYTAILNVHSKGKVPQREHQEKVARLFTNIPDVESADVIKSIDYLSKLLAKIDDINEQFIDVSIDASIKYLNETGPLTIQNEWTSFIKRHGHRCVREAEMLEKEWALDPTPLVDGLKSKTKHLIDGHKERINGHSFHSSNLDDNGLTKIGRIIVRKLLPKARKAVARREQTKAWSIGIQNQIKIAYRHLSELLVDNDLLQDAELIFFLTHDEIGELISTKDAKHWETIANARRNINPGLKALSFPDLIHGVPVPEVEGMTEIEFGDLSGIPVSQGITTGKVRIVRTIEDARKLKKGDIMVARFTDIGWTPFYSVISGLITEIGSPLSHGAVVAREYNLPAVVSMKGAMNHLKTGEKITLDAVKGDVHRKL